MSNIHGLRRRVTNLVRDPRFRKLLLPPGIDLEETAGAILTADTISLLIRTEAHRAH